MITDSPESVRLIRYLYSKDGHKAHLDDIAVEMDNARRATVNQRRGTIRQRYRRARGLLEKARAPVQLRMRKYVVELVIVDDATGRATPV